MKEEPCDEVKRVTFAVPQDDIIPQDVKGDSVIPDSSETNDMEYQLINQEDLESSITKKANQVLLTKEAELDQKRLEKATKDLNSTKARLNLLQRQLSNPLTKISQRKKLRDDVEWFDENELKPRQRDVEDIMKRMEENKKKLEEGDTGIISTNEKLPGETEKEFLIRTGKITAFGTESSFHQENATGAVISHMFLRTPGFEDQEIQKRKISEVGTEEGQLKRQHRTSKEDVEETPKDEFENFFLDVDDPSDEYINIKLESDLDNEIIDVEDEDDNSSIPTKQVENVDDGDESVYQARLRNWVAKRSALRTNDENPNVEEWFKPHPTISDAVLNDQFKLPGDAYASLFDYQKTCVQWLWELYSQKTGGIIGDEMGLGKTIQIIAFLAGLHYSGRLEKPILVVVPATVLNQWVNEFHRWWPPLRVVILHSIGSGMGNTVSEEKMEEYLEANDPRSRNPFKGGAKSQINAKEIIDRVMEKGHVLVTTYVGLKIYSKHIFPKQWGYVVLDEGHKIRNPDLHISLTCKQIKTYNRIILSGTPIQNNLIELWSLFDFVFPGRLGTLPVFQQQFAVPINMGGYANASNVQVQTGYKCAVVLRDLISPYLLRRLKKDVAQDLPKKSEMVLFVKLTKIQTDLYEKFLHSEDLDSILRGKRNMLQGVDVLRKICNHPDLVSRDILMRKKGYHYGDPEKSGKMQVLKNLLQLWQSQKHKTLLFCQTRQMLDILQRFLDDLKVLLPEDRTHFTYLRMDGSTAISKRQLLVDNFNQDPELDVFLLTTRVGGLGVNLTGADRVIIYDPDWNPSTDMQARERAWRLGQKKDITIYRLMTAGSIEEKIYHRQIFKTFLTNKILKDPKQRRFFKVNELHDLFTLGDQNEVGTETGDMFSGSEKNYSGDIARKSNNLTNKGKNDDDLYQVASIMGVSKLDKFEGDEDEGEKENDEILQGIFSKSGVHSTLQHDELIESGNQEVSLVEKEAKKVANEAAEALRQSRKLTRKNAIGTPTWTGRFGLAGKFGPKKGKKSAISSTSIIAGLKSAKEAVPSEVDDKQDTMKKLIDFLQKQPNNFGSSNDILKSLKLKVQKDSEMILMRSMLREICDWDGVAKGWKLKVEFKM